MTLLVSYAFVHANVDADSNAIMDHGNVERNEDQKLMNGDDKVVNSDEVKAISIGEAKPHDVGEFAENANSQVIPQNSTGQTVFNGDMMDLLLLADKSVTKGDDAPDKTVTKGDDTPDKAGSSIGDGMAPSSDAGGQRKMNEIPVAVPKSGSVLENAMGFTSSFVQKPVDVSVKHDDCCTGEGCCANKSTDKESTDIDSFKESTVKAANEAIVKGTKNKAAGCCTNVEMTNMDRKATASDDNDAVRTMIGSINGVNAEAVKGDDADAVDLLAIGRDDVAAKNVALGVDYSNSDAHAGEHGEHDTGSCDHSGTCGIGGGDTATSAAVAVKVEGLPPDKSQSAPVQTGKRDYKNDENIPDFEDLLLKFRQIKSEEQRQKTVAHPDDGSKLIKSALQQLVIAGYDLRISEAILHRLFYANPGPRLIWYVAGIILFACCYCLFISMAFGKCVTYWEMYQYDEVAQCLIKGVTIPCCLCVKWRSFTCCNCVGDSCTCCAVDTGFFCKQKRL